MLSILHDMELQHSLSMGHVPFGLIPPGMLKMTQYPFATTVAPSQQFPPGVKQL